MTSPPEWHHLPANPYNPHAWILGEPDIGEGCWVGAFALLDGSGGLTIGRGCDISAGAHIYTHSTVRRVVSGGTADVERAPTVIGDRVHIGANAVVLMGCTVGDGAVIAAGAVVPQFTEVPAGSVAAGVPARVHPGAAGKFSR